MRILIPAKIALPVGIGVATLALAGTVGRPHRGVATSAASREHPRLPFDSVIEDNATRMVREGRQIFRFDTFGDETFWGEAVRLHTAIGGEKNGGVGPGVSPKTALAVGLKVDLDALPAALQQQLKAGQVDLDDPATTLALLKLNAVVGVTGFFQADGHIQSLGIQCAFCHSTVDDAFAPGIGRRLDGWANRDLNVGAIVSLAPNLKPFSDLLRVDVPTVRKVLASWGPGRFDAELDKDGKAFRPDGKQAGTLIPPAFGLAGVNLHTWTGFGSVPYWNAYVGATDMHAPRQIGVDAWQADRSPTHMYRTAPLAGLWSHQKGGFYHDGRFATLLDVVNHYDTFFKLRLTEQEKRDLVEYLKKL